jgi:murein L,D-transpeptidase YcbB/YkuD
MFVRRALAGVILCVLGALSYGAPAHGQVTLPPPAAQSALPAALFSPGEAREALEVLSSASDHGLGPELAESRSATLEHLSEDVVAYARDVRTGRIAPGAASPEWALQPAPFDPAADLAAARSEGRLRAWLDSLPPPDPAYGALVAARRRYADAIAAGAWPDVPGGAVLAQGAVDPRVAALRLRLAAEGYAAPAEAASDAFDAPLAAALVLYQVHNSLTASGALDKKTLAALGVDPSVRLATIDANLERLRWAPRAPAAERIEVDIAGAQLTLFQSDARVLAMRVIVGDRRHHTPLFAARATAVVFNPPWNVPASIASNELWPKIARDPGYMARNGFSIVDGQLRQAPGPKAALGYVKLDIDSAFGVYLHDTPSRSLFSRDARALSHGCIRVQFPRDLATSVLAAQGWTRDDVEAAIAAKATRRVALAVKLPVILSYRTAVANGDGTVSFRPDVYGWDAQLLAAMARR